jgi:hypothetical protein
MTNKKHFKAVHRETKEEIEFDKLTFYWTINGDKQEREARLIFSAISRAPLDDFEDYELFYKHQGVWFSYETGEQDDE